MWQPVKHLINHRLGRRIWTVAEKAIGTDNVSLRLKFAKEFEPLSDFANRFVAPPSQFRKALSGLSISGEAIEEAIGDYEYFVREAKLRRAIPEASQ